MFVMSMQASQRNLSDQIDHLSLTFLKCLVVDNLCLNQSYNVDKDRLKINVLKIMKALQKYLAIG